MPFSSQGLKWTVAHAYNNSPFYRERLKQAGVTPEQIRTLDDLRRLPCLTAQDLQDDYPFPLRSVPFEKIRRIHASSGTTGRRKVLCYSQKDLDDWADMFARCYEMAGLSVEDRVQIAVGYGLWTAGVGFQLGCERFGAMSIPVGPANTEIHCQMLVDMQSTVFCSTASMALLIAEEIERRGIQKAGGPEKDHLRRGTPQPENAAASPGDHREPRNFLIFQALRSSTGRVWVSSARAHQGIHYWADYYILEILDPETLEPVPPGETGEMVVTTLRKEAAPLIRYRTRDLTRLIPEPCPCGNPLPRHDHLLGRSDDMFIFRAVNIYPGQIDHVLSQIPYVGSEYQVHLYHREDGRDVMLIKVERIDGGSPISDQKLTELIISELRRQILVRPEIELVAYGALPRTERKSKRVFDQRGEVASG